MSTRAEPSSPPERRTRRLPYVGALDGLRAACLLAVMAYHGTFSWAPGGFLGVSTFFTLSGFLITALALVEVRDAGRLDLGRFWSSRARRLLPAAGITLLIVIGFARSAASATQLSGLRQDLWASFGLSVNWRLALSGRAYGGYAAAASPVQHLWSLAVEEQFYLLLPLVVAAGTLAARRMGRPLRQVLGVSAAALAALSTVAMVTATSSGRSITWAYYATHTRAAELLVGVVLACVIHRLVDWPHRRQVVPVVGTLGAAVLVASWLFVHQDDAFLYSGGFLAYSMASVAVIVACLYSSPVRRALDTRPLRWLGRISYGAYLYHWPLFAWLDESQVGLSGYPLFAVQVTATLTLAWLSFRFIEQPIRRGQLLPKVQPPILAGLVASALILTILVPWQTMDTGPSGVEVAQGERVVAASGASQLPSTTAPVVPDQPKVERLLMVGDSVPFQMAPYVAEVLPSVDVRFIGRPGLGPLTEQGVIEGELASAIADFDPDVVLLHFTGSYLERLPKEAPFVLDDGEEVEDGSETMFQTWFEKVDELVATASSRGAMVLWGLVPTVDPNDFFGYLADTVDRFNDGYRQLPGVTIVDWHSPTQGPDGGFVGDMTDVWGRTEPGRADDGLHFTEFGNRVLAEKVLQAVQGFPGRKIGTVALGPSSTTTPPSPQGGTG